LRFSDICELVPGEKIGQPRNKALLSGIRVARYWKGYIMMSLKLIHDGPRKLELSESYPRGEKNEKGQTVPEKCGPITRYREKGCR
jgi:hypothetical protein